MHDSASELPTLPDKPMTLRELQAFLKPLQALLIARGSGTKEADLRLGHQKPIKEAFHAYLFGCAYGSLFGCGSTMTIHVREEKDQDALVRWKNGNKDQKMNLQLKELVSPKLNKNAESVDVELEKILKSLETKNRGATDLTVAIFANYGNTKLTTVTLPDKLSVGALWVFGWSKPNNEELFLIGGAKNEHRFFVSWKPWQPAGWTDLSC